jgi:hypothetical protein
MLLHDGVSFLHVPGQVALNAGDDVGRMLAQQHLQLMGRRSRRLMGRLATDDSVHAKLLIRKGRSAFDLIIIENKILDGTHGLLLHFETA